MRGSYYLLSIAATYRFDTRRYCDRNQLTPRLTKAAELTTLTKTITVALQPPVRRTLDYQRSPDSRIAKLSPLHQATKILSVTALPLVLPAISLQSS